MEKLTQELSATLKDKLSIYFDKNPEEDRKPLYEENSLIPRKIKSLIFIPIISQTYCDTSSLVWNEEFKGFQAGAKNDSFGPTIKMAKAILASRIIPVKIHDIDTDDVKLLEIGTFRKHAVH